MKVQPFAITIDLWRVERIAAIAHEYEFCKDVDLDDLIADELARTKNAGRSDRQIARIVAARCAQA